MKINFPGIINILGVVLLINSALILLCVPVSVAFNDGALLPVIAAFFVNAGMGTIFWGSTRLHPQKNNIKKREGYLIVTLTWLILSLFGTLPFLFSHAIPDFTNAFFETISGYTTTGSSILDDIESLPESILFWRSLTQWIGGLGFIVLALAILPLLGISGLQLFVAEAPGVTPDKIKPRIKESAKRLWFIYIGLTLLETVLLMFGGMSFYDSINHSLTTMSTGGFSVKQASIAFYDSAYIDYVITFFMFLGGTSFVLLYLALKGKINKVWSNEEFRWYLSFILAITLIVTSILIIKDDQGMANAFQIAIFQVVSIITTTGFATTDFTIWGPSVSLIFFTLMFMGGSAGSTSGGVKIVRHLIIAKNSLIEFRRQLHPYAIILVRFNKKPIPHDITHNILAFVIIYITIFGISSVLLSLSGVDALTAVGSVASALGNIGPGLNLTGPSYSFAALNDFAKWVLSALMIIGRLELFTVLILFTRYFWRSN